MASIKSNKYTYGSNIEVGLIKGLDVGHAIDKTTLAFESKVAVNHKAVTDADIVKAGKASSDLDQLMKAAKKKMNALSGLFKL